MSLVVGLQHPPDLVNIAVVVRAMKNFELSNLRMVAPLEYDPHRIEGIAHGSGELLKRVHMFDRLDEALADCTFVAGMTARQRAAKRNMQRPAEAAPELLMKAEEGTAALVLGPEHRGLTNEELDRCHRIITIPTSPDYAALNLAQAFTVMAYTLYVVGAEQPFKQPRRAAPAASHEQFEQLFRDAEGALDAIDFFKTRNPRSIMRTLREVVHRTPLDRREATLLRAMCLEVVRYLERVGVK